MRKGDDLFFVIAFTAGLVSAHIPWWNGFGGFVLFVVLFAAVKIAPWAANRAREKEAEK